MGKRRSFSLQVAFVLTGAAGLLWGALAHGATSDYDITAASYFGGAGSDDRVVGVAIQSNGVVVLAVNLSHTIAPRIRDESTPPIAVQTPGGYIARLTPDGTEILSLVFVGQTILDLACDDSDNLYAALWTDGAVKMDRTAETVLWENSGLWAQRIDAGPEGYCAVLSGDSDPYDRGSDVLIVDPDGQQLGFVSSGKWKYDVCIDEASRTVIYTGFRNAHTSGNPVQIAYVRGVSYDGQVKYTAYDWSADASSPDWLNRPANNMADTRGYRCSIGRDGKLYCAFECAGGNHMFRYSPFDIMQKVAIVGGDRWHEFYNTRSEHKTFFARYDAATGAYLRGQQFCGRLSNNSGNTVRVQGGQIVADEMGRVYLGGTSAWGLPLPGHPNYREDEDEVAFNPFPDGYLGGAWLLVMSEDFRTRLYCTRLTSQKTHAIAARVHAGEAAHIVFGGYTEGEMYTRDPIGSALFGTQDGWFAVIAHHNAGDLNRDAGVDALDLEILVGQWLSAPAEPSADIAPVDGDGLVDLKDLAAVGACWRSHADAKPVVRP
jgi:hypothetical protein